MQYLVYIYYNNIFTAKKKYNFAKLIFANI